MISVSLLLTHFTLVDFGPPECLILRRDDHAMTNGLESIEQVVSQTKRFIQACLRCSDIDEKLLEGLKIRTIINRSAVLEMRFRAANQRMNSSL
ncbi:MAG: hypothetical protein CMM61_11570 [Rhodospirillaceae bacterium]|nr:hypothetical protein [Rhodospirillaceae bacterium]